MGVKLTDKDKKDYKLTSKIIGILARIGNVFCWISAVLLLVCAGIVGVIAPNFSVNEKEKTITIFDQKKSYKIEKNEFSFGDGEDKFTISLSDKTISEIEHFIEKDASRIITAAPFLLLGLAASIVILAFVLSNVAHIFKNIAKEDTPFTEENINRTEKIEKMLIAILLISTAIDIAFNIITKGRININSGITSIFTVLVVYVAAYILKSGYALENKKSK